MKRAAILVLVGFVPALASFVLIAEDKKAAELLQSGVTKETVQGDLKGAIELYQKAAKEAGANRSLAAKAQFRLGAAYQKLGDDQARAAFERIVRDYSDQPEAAEARARLNAMSTPASPAPPVPSLADLLAIRGRGAPGRIRQITLFDRQGRVLAMVGEPAPNGSMTLSPDGKRVAVVKDAAIVVYDVAMKSLMKLTPGPGDAQPTWSPDGRRIDPGVGRNRRPMESRREGTVLHQRQWRRDGRRDHTDANFQSGNTQALFQVPETYQLSPSNAVGFSDVSADGNIFAVSVPQVIGLRR